MTATASLPHIAKRYPTLRFLVGLYKVAGVLILAGGFIFGLFQMIQMSRFGLAGVIAGGITISSGLLGGGMCWLIAEGIEVFIAIEENTRQMALQAARSAAPQAIAAPQEGQDISMAVAYLEASTRLIEQLLNAQQQAGQRLDALATSVETLRTQIDAGVRVAEAVAESSKVTATVLYRQSGKQS